MNLKKLNLEKIKIPKNILKEMEDDVWECFDYEPFVINISSILHKGKEMLSYSLEFPVIFENQKYSMDGSSISINPTYDKEQGKWVGEREFCLKNEYLKYFGK